MNRYISWKQWVYRRPWRQLLLLGVMLLALFVATMTPAVGKNAERFVRQEQAAMVLALESEPDVTLETSLLLQGQRQYEAGQLANALVSWQEAVAQLQSQPLRQAVGLTYVSIAAQDLGDWSQAESAIARSLALVADNSSADDVTRVKSQVLNVQGRLYLKMGQPEMAWEQWEQAEIAYNQAGDWIGSVGAQINQAQALQTMGFYRRAHLKLTEISQELESQPDSEVKASALKSLGTVFQTSGSLEDSRKYLDQSLEIYQRLGSETDIVDTLFTLGNTLRLMQESDEAQNYYKQVETTLPGSLLSTRAKVNRFSLLLDTQAWESAQVLLPTLVTELENLPASREAIYSRVNLAESLLSRGDKTHQPMAWVGLDEVAALLTESAHQADVLKDDRAQSLALGQLSKVYAYTNQWQGSQDLAKRALALSQNSNAQDISYRWQRQLGQAFQQQGKVDDAIQSYTEAVKTLGHVRRDLLATNADVQFSFRETVEPVYREFVNLLLLPDDAGEPALRQAREVIEELQLAELENYFRSACIDSASESIDRLDSEAAVLYPIILPDRVEVIISTPGVPLRHYRTWQTEDETNQTIGQLFQYFNPALSQRKRLRLSKQVYDWLILPAEAMLADQDIQTLVFVLDGQFRRIPMAALYDGEQYLIEKYGVALTPGMKLLGPHFQNPKPLQALMMGLTEARNGFSALPGVREEIEQVAASVNAEVLFDKAFTKDSLAAEIDRVPFPVLHLATHGQFSSNLEETFLLAWDQKITLGDLDDVLRTRRQQAEPIELMVLSACQTAEGDDRASLGLAGMAIRSGARSTLATLWSVNDDSTAKLITQFYEELSNTELSKAEALRFAQIAILKDPEYSHPFYWAPFVLIGNWLS
ncbi:MAG: CHAT domain-containing protein [Leptolyngbyaceae cyanobacterium MAG.088]|nr:CHAT domain-containing protein [Leptolyngbyaceae cyanobacterium MAG.088]